MAVAAVKSKKEEYIHRVDISGPNLADARDREDGGRVRAQGIRGAGVARRGPAGVDPEPDGQRARLDAAAELRGARREDRELRRLAAWFAGDGERGRHVGGAHGRLHGVALGCEGREAAQLPGGKACRRCARRVHAD